MGGVSKPASAEEHIGGGDLLAIGSFQTDQTLADFTRRSAHTRDEAEHLGALLQARNPDPATPETCGPTPSASPGRSLRWQPTGRLLLRCAANVPGLDAGSSRTFTRCPSHRRSEVRVAHHYRQASMPEQFLRYDNGPATHDEATHAGMSKFMCREALRTRSTSVQWLPFEAARALRGGRNELVSRSSVRFRYLNLNPPFSVDRPWTTSTPGGAS